MLLNLVSLINAIFSLMYCAWIIYIDLIIRMNVFRPAILLFFCFTLVMFMYSVFLSFLVLIILLYEVLKFFLLVLLHGEF